MVRKNLIIYSIIKMSINLVICSYGGKYPSRHYDEKETFKYTYLRYYLSALNLIWKEDSLVKQITIMKPKINYSNPVIPNYYNFEDLELDKIKDIIKVVECENKGISYGQFFTAIENDKRNNSLFDYYIFTEDDYMPFLKDFDKILIDNYNNTNPNFLCLSMNHIPVPGGTNHMIHTFNGINIPVPDFAVGILDKNSIQKIYMKYNYETIMSMFERPEFFNASQIIFGYIFTTSGLETICLAEKYLALFNCNSNPAKFLLNNFTVHDRYIQRTYKGEKYENPIFVPIDFFFLSNKKDYYDLVIKYILHKDDFDSHSNILNELAESNKF
jgi:hypothetical protein